MASTESATTTATATAAESASVSVPLATASVANKPAHTKLASSYYYFSSTPTHQASQYMPQLISTSPSPPPPPSASPSSDASASASASASAASNGNSSADANGSSASALPKSSAWNAAGTWEERDVSSWARERLQALLLQTTFPAHEHVKITVSSVKSCTGDASIIFTRGKKKVGFDLELECEWTGKHGTAHEVSGTIRVTGIQETAAGEYDITIKPSSASSSHAHEQKEVIQFVKKHGKECTTSAIDRFIEELMRH